MSSTLFNSVRHAIRMIRNIATAMNGQTTKLDQILTNQGRDTNKLDRILRAVEPLPVARIIFDTVMEGQIRTGVLSMKVSDSKKFTITLAPVDAKGNPSSIDPSKTVFAIDNPALATLTPGSDGLTCDVAAGAVGTGQITATVTDANNPNDTISGTLQLEVIAGDVASLVLNTSEPVDQ